MHTLEAELYADTILLTFLVATCTVFTVYDPVLGMGWTLATALMTWRHG